ACGQSYRRAAAASVATIGIELIRLPIDFKMGSPAAYGKTLARPMAIDRFYGPRRALLLWKALRGAARRALTLQRGRIGRVDRRAGP
ncbi:hypothetical protein, partial [Pararobbsia alpina]|uniref:hypothetical protein n=1 Tax=Pararobbsia alpina TaxID=621374 RepID=UPI001C2EEB48